MSEAPKIVLCPYCGHVQMASSSERCESCGGYFDELSRRVSQQHMGPWFIHDKGRPFRPGCSYQVIVRQIERGKIEPNTILRGPTTKQFWSVARHVPGVAHLLGYCFNCGEHVALNLKECPKCRTQFTAPAIRDELGIDPYDPKVLELAAAMAAQQAGGNPAPPPPSAPTIPARATVVSHANYAAPASPPPRPAVPAAKAKSPTPAAPVHAPAPVQIPASVQTNWMDSGFDGQADTFAEPVAPARSGNLLIWILVLVNVLLAMVISIYLVFNSNN